MHDTTAIAMGRARSCTERHVLMHVAIHTIKLMIICYIHVHVLLQLQYYINIIACVTLPCSMCWLFQRQMLQDCWKVCMQEASVG